MQFNYAKERKQFDEEWKKMRGEYRVAGMSEEDIQIMYEFDLMVFRQRRTYCLHNESREEMEEKQNPIYMESIRFEDNEQLGVGRDNWLDELDNKKLFKAIQKLKKEYRMQVGRACVKLEFCEEAEAGLKERVSYASVMGSQLIKRSG